MVEQDQLVRQLRSLFPTATVVDRRVKPSYGYRAVHVIPNLAGKLVEIQVRSALQHLWAEFSEKLSDQVDQDLKYGGGPRELGELLLDVSTLVAGYEQLLKDTHDAKIRHVRELEEQEAKIKTMHQSLREVLSDAIQKSSGLRRSNS